MRSLKLMILIGGIVFNTACTTKYINVHVPLGEVTNCQFEKFTEQEKESMTESTGRKIFRNQEGCRIQLKASNRLIQAHNELHEKK